MVKDNNVRWSHTEHIQWDNRVKIWLEYQENIIGKEVEVWSINVKSNDSEQDRHILKEYILANPTITELYWVGQMFILFFL